MLKSVSFYLGTIEMLAPAVGGMYWSYEQIFLLIYLFIYIKTMASSP